MDNKELLEIWKRKLVELESKVERLNNDRKALLSLIDEARANRNVNLGILLKDLNLEEEISYLDDKARFHKENVSRLKGRIERLRIEISQQEIEDRILRQQLDDLEKETAGISEEEIGHKEKELVREKEHEKIPEAKIPSPEEIKNDAARLRTESEEAEKVRQQIKELFADRKEAKEPLRLERILGIIRRPIEKAVEKARKLDIDNIARKPSGIKERLESIKRPAEKAIGKAKQFNGKKTIGSPLTKLRNSVKIIKKPIDGISEIISNIQRQKLVRYALPAVMLLLIVSVLLVSKPEITGYAVLTEKNTYEDNLNLIINESGNYTWSVDKEGAIESIKASGRIKGNGTVRIYIEKDGERHLVYGNK